MISEGEVGGGGGVYLIKLPYFKYSDRQALACSVEPDQMPQDAVCDQGLHCLLLTQ